MFINLLRLKNILGSLLNIGPYDRQNKPSKKQGRILNRVAIMYTPGDRPWSLTT